MQGVLKHAKDIAGISGRTVIMFVITLAAIRLMGKRSIAQLAPFDLVVIIIMGSAAALPLEEEQIDLVHGIVPILVMALLQYVLSIVNLKWRGAEKITQGMSRPLVLNGQILYDNLRKERVTVADLYIMLREQGADCMEDIALATLEPTGSVSVIKTKGAQPVTPQDMAALTFGRIDEIRKQSQERLFTRYGDLSQASDKRSPDAKQRNRS